jgi:hypothetical protein
MERRRWAWERSAGQGRAGALGGEARARRGRRREVGIARPVQRQRSADPREACAAVEWGDARRACSPPATALRPLLRCLLLLLLLLRILYSGPQYRYVNMGSKLEKKNPRKNNRERQAALLSGSFVKWMEKVLSIGIYVGKGMILSEFLHCNPRSRYKKA